MPLSEREREQVLQLKGRTAIVLLLVAPTLPWGRISDLAKRLGVTPRVLQLEARKLEKKQWLERDVRGARNQDRLIKFRVGAGICRSQRSDPEIPAVGSRDPGGRLLKIPPPGSVDPSTPYGRARASDPDRRSDLYRPSVLGGAGGTDGRTDTGEKFARPPKPLAGSIPTSVGDAENAGDDELASLRNSVLERVCREWSRWGVTRAVALQGVQRLLNARLTERELDAFLVAALAGKHPAFAGVSEQFRWGQSTSVERIALWLSLEREAERRRPRKVRIECECGAHAEVPASLSKVRCKTCERVHDVYASEADAIGAAVARQMGGT